MTDCHCECACPPVSQFQTPMDPTVPSFPPHVVTPTFWILTTLILLHTFIAFSLRIASGSCTYWLHPYLTSPLRKRAAIAIYTLILAVELHEGFYILKTDLALWSMLVGGAPSVVPYKENLSEWIDWTHGIVGISIPIGVTLGLGLGILVMQWACLTELGGVHVEEGEVVVLEEKDDDLLD
ncbi:hypothetical protein BJX63DRAFT_385523 [Aspergillus granulosus]|uniref:Uncharacterized protein n=1 Tax=Aspergillus granulosus TaxID=176169 RepID=A0ABR4HQ51_9EURO